MPLPPAFTAALDCLLEGVPRRPLAERAQAMSQGYRAGRGSGSIASESDALAYALARAPATFAANDAVLARLAEVWPDFAPATLLDVGAGTGAASWAARARWPGIAVTMLDANPALRDLAGKLMPDAQVVAGDLAAPLPRADLVIASYVLAELKLEACAATARHLWDSAGEALGLVEPGTPEGFARIRAARAALIEAGGHVAAPCTHDRECPIREPDWCHFSQRLARSRDHMALKAARVPFEDERYSHVVVAREKRSSGARILSAPLEAKPGLTFRLCDETGLRGAFVPSRDKDETRRVRKKAWGDLF